jgi:hypothetical protein
MEKTDLGGKQLIFPPKGTVFSPQLVDFFGFHSWL